MAASFPTDLLAQVRAIIEVVAEEEIMSRFRRSETQAVRTKQAYLDPNDLVTAADHAVEARLEDALHALLPDSIVIGEEAVAAGRTSLEQLESATCAWLVDPLDGTRNFVAGNPSFGTMVALIVEGICTHAWIHLPCSRITYSARKGCGSFCNEARLDVSDEVLSMPARGHIYWRYMPEPQRLPWQNLVQEQHVYDHAQSCAALEYTHLIRGERDFVVYHRMLPWDHVPGILLVEECGGIARHFDRSAYDVKSLAATTLIARRASYWDPIHEELSAGLKRHQKQGTALCMVGAAPRNPSGN
jgi:fructose-1,6-bisphosphatase/inositol monophosphatase family enzyme